MQGDEQAARQELILAKQSLSDLTKLPEVSQLQGSARTGVSQVIGSFNALVTAQTGWYERYQEVQRHLESVLNSSAAGEASGSMAGSGTSGSTGTAGSTASGSTSTSGTAGSVGTSGSNAQGSLPAAVRSKLLEFQQHMAAFAQKAGAPGGASTATSGKGGSSTSGSTSGSPVGTSGSSGSTAGSAQTSGSTASGQSGQATSGGSSATAGDTMQQHFDAIADLVQQAMSGGSFAAPQGTSGTSGSTVTGTSGSGTGTSGQTASGATGTGGTGGVTVDRAMLEQIQAHLQRLREIARSKGIQ